MTTNARVAKKKGTVFFKFKVFGFLKWCVKDRNNPGPVIRF